MTKTAQQVAILAGGLGTRLKPITEKIPKPLVEVAGKPFLYWQLLDLKAQGFNRVLLLVSYLGEQIESYFGNGDKLGLQIEYAWEKEPLGTGGALRNAYGQLDESFVLLNGDSFLHAPLMKMTQAFAAAQPDVRAMISTYAGASPVIANLRIQGDLVLAYRKGGGREAGCEQIDSGIYVLQRDILLKNEQGARFQLEELWPELIAAQSLRAFTVSERFYDIGTIERLKEFEEKVRDYFQNSISS
jgi:MurNAc alpha-1-phosphate uridylyltransferase